MICTTLMSLASTKLMTTHESRRNVIGQESTTLWRHKYWIVPRCNYRFLTHTVEHNEWWHGQSDVYVAPRGPETSGIKVAKSMPIGPDRKNVIHVSRGNSNCRFGKFQLVVIICSLSRESSMDCVIRSGQ